MATGRPGGTAGQIESTDTAQAAVSDDDKAAAQSAAEKAKSSQPGGRFVLYTGPRTAAANAEELKNRQSKLGEGTYAEIKPEQWAEVGIAADKALVWRLQNNYLVPASDLSDAQLNYLLANSTRFELVDGDGKPVQR